MNEWLVGITDCFIGSYPEGWIEEETLYDLTDKLIAARVTQEAANEGKDGGEEIEGEVFGRDLLQQEAK